VIPPTQKDDMSDRHAEIAEAIRARIRGGEYQPGRRIPSQSEMADEFDIPHRMIAFVIAELREQGYVWTIPHRGSYVRPPEDWKQTGR
jgi:DNA-binding GntR family transcriptional regulator